MTNFIDWQRVRERLAATDCAMDSALRLSPNQARLVMDARAIALSRIPDSTTSVAEAVEFLTFQLAEELFALEVHLVREVRRLPDVTPVPGTPAFVRGITNLRGEILAVIDLGQLLVVGVPCREDCPWLIVLGRDRAEFGIVCNAVREVLTLRIDALLKPAELLSGVGREYARGVTREAIIVLDGVTVLNDSRLFIDEVDEASP